MSTEKLLASITELNDSNDIYMSLDVLLLTSRVNLNGAKFLPEFIHEVVENKDFYTGIPLVCERSKLEKGKYKNLTHALKKDGFHTDQVGSYVDFYEKEADNGEWELFGTVRVFKRFKAVCNAIVELFNDNSLFFSVEVFVEKYNKKDKKVREIGANVGNKLIGDAIVSYPAEKASKCYTLIAEALENDIGGEVLKTFEEFFEKSKIHFENSELDIYQVQKKVYSKLKETYSDKLYDFYSTDFGVNYMVLQNYSDGDYYKVDYTVSENDVSVSDMYKVTKNYLPVKSSENSSGKNNNTEEAEEMTIKELETKLEQSEIKNSNLEKEIENKNTVISEKDTLISENEKTINELNEKINTLSESVILKDNEIAELSKSKEELDKINTEKELAEKEQKKVELKEKYSKLLPEEVLSAEEIAQAIEELNESVLQTKVVDIALTKSELSQNTNTQTEVSSTRVIDNMNMSNSDVVSKYITVGQ
jgi:hypothetical protein